MAYLGEEMDVNFIGSAMGLYISGNALGGMTGRIGSALLCDYVSWHTAITIVGIISLLFSLIVLKSLPPSTNFRQRPFQTGYLFTSLYQHLHDPGLLCLYGLAFLGGWVEQIGGMLGNDTARTIGTIASLVMPSESLWQLAAHHMQPPIMSRLGLTPFSPASVPTPAMVAATSRLVLS